ncbi:MAG: hypothetical protein EOL87_03670 [Spartobacteria bacterium]|nr:hypothetical protein [Spartobacteria bacterium]
MKTIFPALTKKTAVAISVLTLGLLAFAVEITLKRATVDVVETSSPAGFVDRTTAVSTPSEHTTMAAPMEQSDYRFTHWTLNGERAAMEWDQSVNPARFMVYEGTDAIAHYVPQAQDTVGLGLPDWVGLYYYGNLNNAPDSDTDGDGRFLKREYELASNPNLSNSVLSGGISMRPGPKITFRKAGYVIYSENSRPEGFLSRKLAVQSGSVVTSQNPTVTSQGYSFTGWEVNGLRQTNALGMSRPVFSMPITSDTTATAVYVETTLDSNADGVPDWWQLQHYGHLDDSASSDTDHDGLSLLREYQIACNPVISNTVLSGGISMRPGPSVSISLIQTYPWTIASDPAGLITSQSGTATNGQIVSTASLGTEISSYQFGYWTLNGTRQTSPNGAALPQLDIPIHTTVTAVAHYFPVTQDSRNIGVPDWWQYRYYAALDQAADSDTDNDGLSLLREYQLAYSPLVSNSVASGGISMRPGPALTLNLQFFERVTHVQVTGVYTHVFSFSPEQDAGWDFGATPSAAVGDWDGDGDPDLFVVASNSYIQLYENIGSATVMNLKPHTGYLDFAGKGPYTLAMGDWSGDGYADLAIGQTNGEIRLLSSWGGFHSGVPAVDTRITAGSSRVIPALGALDATNRVDLLVWHEDGSVALHTNSGSPQTPFDATPSHTNILSHAVPQACGLAVAQVDANDSEDILVSDADGRIWEFVDTGSAQLQLQSKVWAGSGAGQAEQLTLAATDLDGDGDTDALTGYQQGGIIYLRDPRIAIPSGLQADGGAGGIRLRWLPNMQHRIVGYHVYRSEETPSGFAKITDEPITEPRFMDENVQPGTTYYYNLIAVSAAHLPGYSELQYRESPSCSPVSALAGCVHLTLDDFEGRAGDTATLRVNARNAAGIAANNFAIDITYDPSVLLPLTQVETNKPTVIASDLTWDFQLSDNAANANGLLQVRGNGTTVIPDEGKLFDVHFAVQSGLTAGTTATNSIQHAVMQDQTGSTLAVNLEDTACFTVTSQPFLPGDVDADGQITRSDMVFIMHLSAQWREPTAYELMAGDLNGNGVLDTGDAHLVNRMLH